MLRLAWPPSRPRSGWSCACSEEATLRGCCSSRNGRRKASNPMEHPTKVDVGGYQLAYQSFGSGQPTVVFESGSECGGESLAMLARAVQYETRAVLYDRAS